MLKSKEDSGNNDPVQIKTLQDLIGNPIQCCSPDQELDVSPKWIVFYSDNNYKTPVYYTIQLTNTSKYTQAYTIKTRAKIFKIAKAHCGILKGGESVSVKLFVIPIEDWPLGLNDYCDKRLKIVVENLRLPENVVPANFMEEMLISKHIWKKSHTEWPLERLYSKISICLDKSDGAEDSTQRL